MFEPSKCWVLWDASQLWGILVIHALKAFDIPFRVVSIKEITQELNSDKRPNLLIVPGGTARLKSQALGQTGKQAILSFVATGGNYLGFCGGAGLGLNNKNTLGLCPWERETIADRLQHLVSGYMLTDLNHQHELVPKTIKNAPDASQTCSPLPIWYPGRFGTNTSHTNFNQNNPINQSKVEVLAAYNSAGPDFRVADLALSSLPKGTLQAWEKEYGICIGSGFMQQQPCIVHGKYGQGSYTLSYSHLETPASPSANLFFSHLLEKLAELKVGQNIIEKWNIAEMPLVWHEKTLEKARLIIQDLFNLGFEHYLFYERSSWLIGWKTGIPGANMNNLRIALAVLLSEEPSQAMLKKWSELKHEFETDLELFHKNVTHLLLAERLAGTLAKTAPEAIRLAELQAKRLELFGHPMEGGGLYLKLWTKLDALLRAKWIN
ncbi:BPL-N domain-containing protein [Desulfovibrio litoralis]|uniref:Biotin-protein ligase, N terminal n=1 Tax=Desulfovibrio litoralis DSM 11393 TaxID=1121455 RepID=A0A1M7T6H9_9BACT|nr:BPL-N domain-containing protein [Desulfovibrio litoralis]SHN66285.1 Biotin-protein ligase, N terminal [Desulfovibrio litoralis DSM 11393]